MTDDLVTLYSQPSCGPCFATKRYLEKAGVPHVVVNVREDPAAAAVLKRHGMTGTPAVIATVAGKEYAWQGHRTDQLAALAYLVTGSAA
jgi:glutaredoxin-like protein NrdH